MSGDPESPENECRRLLVQAAATPPSGRRTSHEDAQKGRFERGGWKIGTASGLLVLTEAEEALVETKLRLGDVVRTLREKKHLS